MRRSDLFITRTIDDLAAEVEPAGRPRLRRALGPLSLIGIGLGSMVGAGIFASIGLGVQQAGPAVVISFLLTAVASALAALCFAEIASMVPIAGSAYTYAYATLGEFVAWIVGWNLIIEYAVATAPVASTLSSNVQAVLGAVGIRLPLWATSAYSPSGHTVFDVLAAGAVMLFTALLVIGIRESVGTNSTLVILKMTILAAFPIIGLGFVRGANWHLFAPAGFHGIIAGAFTVFFAYIGFDSVTVAAEEARKPQRDIPIGVVGSLAIAAVWYIAVAAVLSGMQPASQVNAATPLATALGKAGLSSWSRLMNAGAILATISVILTGIYGQVRIFYVMARDGLLPKWLAAIHPRTLTPVRMTLLTGTAIALLAGLVPLDALVSLVNIATFSIFMLVSLGVMVLRRLQPDRPRPFRAPLYPAVPLAGIAVALFLVFYGTTWVVWLRFAAWLVVGITVYFAYSYRHSEARKATLSRV